MRICHLTSSHLYTDARIFHKECCSLAAAGFEVHLVAPSAPNKVINGIRLHGNDSRKQSRLYRFSKNLWSIYRKALAINADLYHFHDPDLLVIGLLLKMKNKKVIYDAHEDVRSDILDKYWIPKATRRLTAKLYGKLENVISKYLDLIIVANPPIYDRFNKIGCNTININNYPISDELIDLRVNWQTKQKAVCYLGDIGDKRGIFEMIAALEQTNVKLLLAGNFVHNSQREQAISMKGWQNVRELGYLDRKGIKEVLLKSIGGLSILHPIPSYTYALATKMFEYMASAIPVIASNFPLWEDIVNTNKCGICVDPFNPNEIANAINWIADNSEEARLMGENGRMAVMAKYNWENESKKLVQSYQNILS